MMEVLMIVGIIPAESALIVLVLIQPRQNQFFPWMRLVISEPGYWQNNRLVKLQPSCSV